LVEVLASYSNRARFKLDELSTVRDALDRIDAGKIRRPPPQNDRPSQRYCIADRFPPEEMKKLIDRYKAGVFTTTLAADYNIAHSSVLRILKREGVPLRSRYLSDQQKVEILRLREHGVIIRDIAKRVGCSYDTARKFLLTTP
jgi:hypothetical protein